MVSAVGYIARIMDITLQTFFLCVCVCVGGGGGQIGQILGPFMITHGLSCDRVGFGHLEGGERGRGGVRPALD